MALSRSEQKRTPVTAVAKERFLAAYRNCANIRAACDAAGVGRTTFYEWRDGDPEFAAQLGHAGEDAIDSLEAAGWLRARKTSDSLLKYFLSANRPDKYRGVLKIDWRNVSEEQLIALARGSAEGALPPGDILADDEGDADS